MKKNSGITLISLVITIVVLLILAGITLRLVISEDGIIARSREAKEAQTEAEIKEKIKLAEMAAKIDGQGVLTEDNLEAELKNEFGKTSLDEGWIDKTSVTGKWIITIDEISVEVPEGTNNSETGEDLEESSTINYGAKTVDTVVQGDTISIEDEQFLVLKKDSFSIIAVPYYNITLPSILLPAEGGVYPEQSTTATSIEMASTDYWQTDVAGSIDMTQPSNNVQKYITAYSSKLSSLTNGKASAHIGTYDNQNAWWDVKEYEGISNASGQKLLNPTGVGEYWLDYYYYWEPYGYLMFIQTDGTSNIFTKTSGVRPIIKIDL